MGSNVLLAHKYAGEDVTGWWASEKLDGVRAYWDGSRLISRSGNARTFRGAPAWFTDSLPRGEHLDGELWLGRGKFNECSGVVRRHDWGDDAQRILYVCFDAPAAPGGFEDRQARLVELLAGCEAPRATCHYQYRLQSPGHLRQSLRHIESLGGEGLIVRAPGSGYVRSRSSQCLKVKSIQDDEAVVTEHYRGKQGKPGVYADWHGVPIKVANGFRLDGSDRPPVGATFTFGYFERMEDTGKPRFPVFLGERGDA